MGAFFTNLHVEIESNESVVEAVKRNASRRAYVTASTNNWVSVFAEATEDEDDELESLAADLSKSLNKPVLRFMVHDSDVFCYWLHEGGQVKESYNSKPDYFHDIFSEPSDGITGGFEQLLQFCKPGVTKNDVAKTLCEKVTFEENRAVELARLLGLKVENATIGFLDITESEPEIRRQFKLVRGAKRNDNTAKKVAFEAVQSANHGALKSILESGFSARARYPGGNLLSYAIAGGNPEIVKLLLDHGADACGVNGDPSGRSPLILASVCGAKSEIIELLIKAGGDVNQACDIKFSSHSGVVCRVTPLMYAARLYQFDVVKTLLKFGADRNIRDSSGITAIDYALQKKDLLAKSLDRAAKPAYLKDCLGQLEQVIELLSRPD